MEINPQDWCSKEPIHIPGGVQTHGMLIAIDKAGVVQYMSENLSAASGIAAQDILGNTVCQLSAFFGKKEDSNFVLDLIDLATQDDIVKPVNPYPIRINNTAYNLIITPSESLFILDIEPEDSNLFEDPQNLVGASLSQMLADRDLDTILGNTVVQIRKVIGYDRVMIYKFHRDGHGEVVAEDYAMELESWLGLHYPASDIPAQARELYKVNLVRLIADVSTAPAQLLSNTERPLDLTHSSLRAVSPMHIRYLKNMQVASSFSVSIVVDGLLWGLIACHNYSPRFINYRQRETAKLIGQVLSSCVGMRDQEAIQKERIKLQGIIMEVTRSLQHNDRIPALVDDCGQKILQGFRASGFVLFFEGAIYSVGDVPAADQIEQIANQFAVVDDHSYIRSNKSMDDFTNTELNSERFAGVLSCRLTHGIKDCLILFRPEQASTVKWAGDPNKLVSIDEDGQPFISPRNSFDQWVQECSGQAEDWTDVEIEVFVKIRDELNFAIGRKIEELRLLNDKLRDAYAELDSFTYTVSHDLKTPLTAIRAYAELIQRKSTEPMVFDMAEKIRLSAVRLNQMVQTVLEYSKVGQKFVNKQRVDMSLLIAEIKDHLLMGKINDNLNLQVLSTPELEGDPILLFQVFLNVIENAVKYSHKQQVPTVVIEGDSTGQETVYRITDNGVGISEQQRDTIFDLFSRVGDVSEFEGTGVGLATVRKIMIRHGAEITVESKLGSGSTFVLRFPKEIVA
ncbi:ATP-binding protein [Sphingobacterium paludis]|uniref:histidine kinase n=1 Tax=Sphingobacterium paludis TaxID=1476465 RepID=A0A4R7CZ50_9SPHI|nr:ATP-binding protein [Sphingobacterium paludis]TDS13182.1 light-regulated signal transduction histidine kinase (bacteriophytochrome) [Sphingobacterium paludis]